MAPRKLKIEMPELFPQGRRSKGKHVSHAIHTIMNSIYPDRFGDRPIDITRANLGNALEKAIVRGLVDLHPDRFVIPGELFHDDMYGTPDLWDIGNGTDWITCEIKLTWASSRRAEDIEDSWFWRYWTQLKAYCHMAGCTRGRLYICFVNGDYSRDGDGGGPTVMGWEDRWDEEELAENWAMLKAQKQ